MLKDRFDRPLLSLRISVTKSCDYACIFCHKEGLKTRGKDELTPEEIASIAKAAMELGILKVKITGGEPLLRDDIVEIVRKLKEVGMKEVSITTNGHRLYALAEELAKAGLSRVNVSLPSLKREKYHKITGMDMLDVVLKGIEKAYDLGIRPVKLNYVMMKGLNEDEIDDMLSFVRGRDMILQIIELEKANPSFYLKHHMNIEYLEKEFARRAIMIVKRTLHNRRQYLLDDGAKVEVVRPMHNTDFCMGCTRIRVTPDGKLKPCLFRNDNLVNVKEAINLGVEELKRCILLANERREPFFLKRGVSAVPA